MTDKEIIRAEIERHYKMVAGRVGTSGECSICQALLSFIDSMQEESASEDLEVEFNHFLDEVEGLPRMWHSEEQMEWAMDIARHFAIWQKRQITKNLPRWYKADVETFTIAGSILYYKGYKIDLTELEKLPKED